MKKSIRKSLSRMLACCLAAAITVSGMSVYAQGPSELEEPISYTNPLSSINGLENIGKNLSAEQGTSDATCVTGSKGVVLSGSSGNHWVIDTNSPNEANGIASVEISNNTNYLTGLMFRTSSTEDYTWVGLTQNNTFILREGKKGAPSYYEEIIENISGDKEGTLKAEYQGDTIRIYMNDVKVYDGLRPIKKYAPELAGEIPTGQIGFMGWSEMNAEFANLKYVSEEESKPEYFSREAYESYLNTVDNGLVQEDFTQKSWENYQKVKEEAVTALENYPDQTTDEEMKKAYEAVVDARNALSLQNPIPEEGYVNDFSKGIEGLEIINGEMTGEVTEDFQLHHHGDVSNEQWVDTTLPSTINGEVSVDVSITNMADWRVGLIFRATDENNFTAVMLDSSNALRIREISGGAGTDLHSQSPSSEYLRIPQIQSLPQNFNLKVQYYGDYLRVWADDILLYDGVRTLCVEADEKGTIAAAPNYGKVGVFAWSVHDFKVDNLAVKPYFPAISSVSVEECLSSEIDEANHKIVCYMPSGFDLTSIEPVFTALPEETVILPEGPQNFSEGPIVYTLSLPDGTSCEWEVSIKTVEDSLASITDGKTIVWLNKNYPQVYSYEVNGKKMDGAKKFGPQKIKINDVSYSISTVDFSCESNKATYTLTIPDVDLDGSGPLDPREVQLTYEFTVEDGALVKRLTKVEGDDENTKFVIQLEGPVLSATAQTVGDVQLAFNGDVGANYIGQKVVYDVVSDGQISMSNRTYAFISNRELSGTLHINYQYTNPFEAKISDKTATISEQGWSYRLADGTIPVREIDGKEEPVDYECRVYLCEDENESGTVDWQDSAMWVREQIPQVPEDLRDFFNGGNWLQVHGAFTGNTDHMASDTYIGSSTLLSSPEQLVEIQRQIRNMTDNIGSVAYCLVGWNGTGHDYGWPNINEVPLNPLYGSEEQYRASQELMEKYGGSLGFHLNMTDMTTVSESYRRGTEDSELSRLYGNYNSSTGGFQYNAFGWSATTINHYTDYKFAMNRQNAFVERFNAPFILYQDVMLAYPKGAYGVTEEHYAMRREIDHWKTLGVYAATEYYYPEKRAGGQFMMKNFLNPNIVDAFITAGQTMYHSTRNYATETTDYIWASLYSDDARTGNIMINNVLEAPEQETEFIYLLSNTNAYVSQNDLLQFVDEGNVKYTKWSNGIEFRANNSDNTIQVTRNGEIIADLLDKDSLRLQGDAFVPAVDGTSRIFAYSSNGTDRTWTLQPETLATSYDLYRMTGEGRVYVGKIIPQNGTVQFQMEPGA